MTEEAIFPPTNAAAPPELLQMAESHAQWLASEGKEGKRASFRGMDLTAVNMAGWHLVEASFRGTNLTGANLSSADLRTADLSEAILDGADLTGTLLSGASLARAQLHHANAAGADFVTANLTAAIAEGINLAGAKLNGAILRDCNLRHANLSHAILRDANLRSATIVEANLNDADLTSADCRDVNFDRSSFVHAQLSGTNFRDAKLGDVDIKVTDFSVALDVPTEVHAQSFQSERAKLQEEQAQIASLRASIEQRERALADERAVQNKALARAAAEQERIASTLVKLSFGFTVRFVLWLLIAGLIVAFAVARILQADVTRFTAVLGVVAFVTLLALFSAFRSLQIARLIAKKESVVEPPSETRMQSVLKAETFAASPEPQLPVSSEPQLLSEPLTPSAPDATLGAELGFGRKKK